MSYDLAILPRAQKELAKVPSPSYERIRDQIRDLARNPRPRGTRKLTGRSGFRLRVGSYRILYDLNDSEKKIVVLHVGHRRDVYRG